MKRKTFFIITGAVVLTFIVIAGGFWYMSMQPFYKPGMVREMGTLLTPPNQPIGGQ